jgi:ubiquinone/menaquinone biosynthesis C-methylase UbiE
MSETDKIFNGSIPEFYDTYLVPLIFKEFAEDLALRVSKFSPANALEIAAGSGVVTRAFIEKLGARSRYSITDLNQAMLDYAKTKQKDDNRLTWLQADALELPFQAAEFDVVFCQFGVMFFPDRVTGYKETKRVLRSDGVFIFNVWDKIAENEFADIVTDAAAQIFPDDPPQFLARTPHGYHDVDLIEDELQQAGFARIEIETLEKTSIATKAENPAIAYCQGTPLRTEIEMRDPTKLDLVIKGATSAITEKFGAKPSSSKIQGHVITAHR